jgi:tRNA modification GTPase
MSAETIFALSSGSGRAGVAVVRVSGPAVPALTRTLIGIEPPARQAALRRLRDPVNGEGIDDALVLFFKGPASFSGEDLVEFHVHGSLAVIRKLLTVLGQFPGCRMARAGEFARRAFENGKIDLVESESLADLIDSETEWQRRLAFDGSRQLRTRAQRWRRELIECQAEVEALIDFSDESDVQARLDSDLERHIAKLAGEIDSIRNRINIGKRIQQGFRVAILGPPNAGKSSLVNALADRDVAITSPIPGTTRDAIETTVDFDGLPVVLVDTAGLRLGSEDPIERIGMERARMAGQKADFVVWLSAIDSQAEPSVPVDLSVWSKADLGAGPAGMLSVSAITGRGIDELVRAIQTYALEGGSEATLQELIAHERHAQSLGEASAALKRAVQSDEATLDIRAEELRSATSALDSLIGRVHHELVLDVVFSRFCIGK